jgi:hypothetical protein
MMKESRWTTLLVIFVVTLLVGLPQALDGAEKMAPGAVERQEESNQGVGGLGQIAQNLLRGLTENIQIPQATEQSFAKLFTPHRAELERLAGTHQDLVWEALAVVIEALPSFKNMEAKGGKLVVDRKTFAKATGLLERCEALVSPELARDMRKARALVDRRVKSDDPENVIIDLREGP